MNSLLTEVIGVYLCTAVYTTRVLVFASLTVILCSLLLAFIVRHLYKNVLKDFTKKTKTPIDDLFVKHTATPFFWLIILGGIFIGVSLVPLSSKKNNIRLVFRKVMETLIAVDVTWLLLRLVDLVEAYLYQLKRTTHSRLDDKLLPIMRKIIKVFLIIIAALMIIQNLGYSVTGLWAGLGIGGLAIALASRDTVSNIFGSIVIFADRLFRVGDRISAAGAEGVIEEIGFRSTRVRTATQTLVTIPNSTVAGTKVENLSDRPYRGITFSLALPATMSLDEIRDLKQELEHAIGSEENIIEEKTAALLSNISTTGATLEIVCYTDNVQEDEFLRTRERVFFTAMKIMKEKGLSE